MQFICVSDILDFPTNGETKGVMPMPAPCAGCPPCCDDCPISSTAAAGADLSRAEVIVPDGEYGCAKGYDGLYVLDGILGQKRDGEFHPVTDEGGRGLRERGNPLAQYLTQQAA